MTSFANWFHVQFEEFRFLVHGDVAGAASEMTGAPGVTSYQIEGGNYQITFLHFQTTEEPD